MYSALKSQMQVVGRTTRAFCCAAVPAFPSLPFTWLPGLFSFKAIQRHSKLFKGIQSGSKHFEKKNVVRDTCGPSRARMAVLRMRPCREAPKKPFIQGRFIPIHSHSFPFIPIQGSPGGGLNHGFSGLYKNHKPLEISVLSNHAAQKISSKIPQKTRNKDAKNLHRSFSVLVFGFACSLLFFALNAGAQTNYTTAPLVAPPLPDAGVSLLRVMGALALVIGIFLGGVWLFKNWQRLAIQRGRAPKLSVLETRSLGGRHAIYVIGYDQQRFLISSSPGGVNFLSHLPAATEGETPAATGTTPPPTFTQALSQVLKGK